MWVSNLVNNIIQSLRFYFIFAEIVLLSALCIHVLFKFRLYSDFYWLGLLKLSMIFVFQDGPCSMESSTCQRQRWWTKAILGNRMWWSSKGGEMATSNHWRSFKKGCTNSKWWVNMNFRQKSGMKYTLVFVEFHRKYRALESLAFLLAFQKRYGCVLLCAFGCWLTFVRTSKRLFVAGLGEFKLRDLNDEINKLLREKGHWEDQILVLGGPDYRVRLQQLFWPC